MADSETWRRYDNPHLLSILGGKRVIIESPLIKEIVAEGKQEATNEAIRQFLQARFGHLNEEIVERLLAIAAEKKLKA